MSFAAVLRRASSGLYGVYAWLALLAFAIPLAIAFLVTPGVARRRRLGQLGAAGFLWAIGSRPSVAGLDHLNPGPCVVVANHSSYLDGIILMAVLPPRFSFLIKHEMAAVPIAGFVLRGLGSRFVDREDAVHRHRTARRLIAAAAEGDALVVFPEGTFDARVGLRRFQRGAFLAAWRGQAAVVPAAISGARVKLPARAWFPAPGPLAVKICAPLDARAYGDAMELLAATRNTLLAELKEPDLR